MGRTSDGRPRALRAVALCLGLLACGRPEGLAGKPEPGDAAVAKVDGHALWKSDVVREAVAQGLIGEGEALDPQSELFQRVLDEVVDQRLLALEAVRRGLDKSAAAQRRLQAVRERILGDMVVEGAVKGAVTEASISALYAEQLKQSRGGDEYRARQIVVADQAAAESIRKQVASGASFASLASSRSSDSETRGSGGDLGYVTVDAMPRAYARVLLSARAGQLLGPFKADSGWVLLKVEDRRRPAQPTLEGARPQIVRYLTYAQVGDLLKSLRAKGRVELLTGPISAPAAAPAQAKP